MPDVGAWLRTRLGTGTATRLSTWSCEANVAREPLPLYSPDLGLALLWTPKAACTFAVKWFFWHAGILDEVLAYSSWPHFYREQVYCRRPGYRQDLRGLLRPETRVVKFVRDPFARAVSGYLSVCDQVHRLTHPPHAKILAAAGEFLGRPVGEGRSLSFREYVAFLDSIDLDTCDVHLRRQVHPLERRDCLPHLRVIKVEESAAILPSLERELGLAESDLDPLQRSAHYTTRVETGEFVGDRHFTQTLGPPVPVTRAFYDAELVTRVRRLYAADCEAYGYEHAPGPVTASA